MAFSESVEDVFKKQTFKEQLLLRPTAFKKAVLLVDSKYAIQMIASNEIFSEVLISP